MFGFLFFSFQNCQSFFHRKLIIIMNRILIFPFVNFHRLKLTQLSSSGSPLVASTRFFSFIYGYGNRFYSTSPSPLHRNSALDVRNKVNLGDNLQIRYKVIGEGSQTVLCLPGIIGSIETDFGPLLEPLAKDKGFTVVSWDPPGYGYSRPPDRDFSGDFYRRDADVVIRMMDKLGFSHYAILGWSSGGVTGGFVAANRPENVTKLVTWGAHGFADDRAVLFSKMMGNLENWSEKMKSPMLNLYGESYLQKMLTDWGNAVDNYQKTGLDADYKNALTNIHCPTLVIHGELDPVLGVDHAEFLQKHIRNSVYDGLKIFPAGKHNLHLRFKDEFLKVVVPFLLDE